MDLSLSHSLSLLEERAIRLQSRLTDKLRTDVGQQARRRWRCSSSRLIFARLKKAQPSGRVRQQSLQKESLCTPVAQTLPTNEDRQIGPNNIVAAMCLLVSGSVFVCVCLYVRKNENRSALHAQFAFVLRKSRRLSCPGGFVVRQPLMPPTLGGCLLVLSRRVVEA